MLKSCFCQSANHMNSSLLSLYRKGNPDSVSNTPEMEQKETITSSPRISSRTGSVPSKTPARGSEEGWFIDKTPGGKKDSFFSHLSDEKCNDKKLISEIEVFFYGGILASCSWNTLHPFH